MIISTEEARKIIKSQKGRFFTVDFVKKNGEYRMMNGRLGVKKYLKGGDNPLKNSDDPNVFVMFDRQIKNYRIANLNTAIVLRANGGIYKVVK